MAAVRDPEQLKAALASANETRSCIAEFKRDTAVLPRHEAVLAVIEAVETRYEERLGAARVRHLLTAVGGIGDQKARKLLTVSDIYNHDKRLRDLTARQRALLVSWLETQGWRRT